MSHNNQLTAEMIHRNVPPDWYFVSIRKNLLQRYWHKIRFKTVASIVPKTDGKILDIGSADGMFTQVIAKKSRASQVIGIDVLRSSVDWANNHWKKNKKLRFIVADAHNLPFKNSEFNAVFALEVLEHVKKPVKVLAEIKRVLKTGGYCVFLVPTDSFLFKFVWDNIWTKTRGKIWDDTHIQTYKDDKLVKLSKKAGFKVLNNKKFIFGMLQVIKMIK